MPRVAYRPSRNLRDLLALPVTLPALARRFGARQVNLAALRRVAVFPDQGLAFNRIKNANASTLILLRQLETGCVEGSHEANRRVRNLLELRSEERRCLSELHFFVVVRDPYSRVLSAFLKKFQMERYRRRYGAFPVTPEGFEVFLRWLDRGGLRGNAHWDLQRRLMFLPLAHYDTVIRFERLGEEVGRLLAARGIAMPDGALQELYPSERTKATGATERMGMFYTPARAEIVRRLYAEDFRALGYDTAFPG